jgi:hypothetical protein
MSYTFHIPNNMDNTKNCNCTASSPDPLCAHRNSPYHLKQKREQAAQCSSGKIPGDSNDQPDIPIHEINQGLLEQLRIEEDEYTPRPLVSRARHGYPNVTSTMVDNSAFMQMNRRPLRKFEALNINGSTLTGMSIGGFEVDLSQAASKAMEVLPLPASKLPVIFADDELNFYHHFFGGLCGILGQSRVEVIAEYPDEDGGDEPLIIGLVEDLVEVGYEKTDTEIILFLKKVFTTTFELLGKSRRSHSNEEVVVASNIWGFQYIEAGMKCSEETLRMWISMCYNHYRTIWFNTFKSTWVPGFSYKGAVERKTQARLFMKSDTPHMLSRANVTKLPDIAESGISGKKVKSVRTTRSRHGRKAPERDAVSRFWGM